MTCVERKYEPRVQPSDDDRGGRTLRVDEEMRFAIRGRRPVETRPAVGDVLRDFTLRPYGRAVVRGQRELERSRHNGERPDVQRDGCRPVRVPSIGVGDGQRVPPADRAGVRDEDGRRDVRRLPGGERVRGRP